MVANRREAVQNSLASHTNTPGFCQGWVNIMFHGQPVGDFDGDGDADAVDGWKSEHGHQHDGDRNPPAGVPVAWSGGSHGFGHRAISLGHGLIRSTDAGGSGVVATVSLDWPERAWGLRYLGWSETIGGVLIPMPPPPAPTRISKFRDGAPNYDLKLLDTAISHGRKGTVRVVRNQIVREVHRLPGHERDTRVQEFVDHFNSTRVLRMRLLFHAVQNGRTGLVKDVFDSIHHLIGELPRR